MSKFYILISSLLLFLCLHYYFFIILMSSLLFLHYYYFFTISIGIRMVSSAIWIKRTRVSFSKSIKIADECYLRTLKLTSVCFIQISRETILLQRERGFHRDIQSRENNVWKHEREARMFSYIVFECLDIPVRHELELFIQCVPKKSTLYRNYPIVIRVLFFGTHCMASQMNRDVTECFRLLIWIEFLITKHNVIRNSIQVILHA
jgi:hypothetical protein